MTESPNNHNKTLVLGLGNVIMGDEGVGVHVVRAIEKHTLPAGVECLDGGTGGFILLEPLQSAGRIILIDAAADGLLVVDPQGHASSVHEETNS